MKSRNYTSPKTEALEFENAPIAVVNGYQRTCSARFWDKVRVGTKLTGRGNSRHLVVPNKFGQ